MTIHVPKIPTELIQLLEKRKGQYTDMISIYHFLWLGGEDYCGVAGDGANGSYEWFLKFDGKFETSDVGFGATEFALKEILQKV